ncbi:hypothetical protein ACFL2U_03695, partial [Patescibacteria group bacterium]
LKRLGVLPHEKYEKLTDEEVHFPGNKIVNILDRKYKKGEDKALELIKNSKYSEFLDNIIYYYY